MIDEIGQVALCRPAAFARYWGRCGPRTIRKHTEIQSRRLRSREQSHSVRIGFVGYRERRAVMLLKYSGRRAMPRATERSRAAYDGWPEKE